MFEKAKEVQRRCFSFDIWVGGDDDFFDFTTLEAAQELLNAQLFRSDAVERRKRPMQHVVAPAKLPGPLNGELVGDTFDDADQPVFSPGVEAKGAGRVLGSVVQAATGGAEANAIDGLQECLGEFNGEASWLAQDVEGETLRGLLADAREAGELRHQSIEGVGRHGMSFPRYAFLGRGSIVVDAGCRCSLPNVGDAPL